MKKNEILLFVAMWVDLENIILSEVSQVEKDKYCMISLIVESEDNTHDSIYKTETDSRS